MIITKQIEIDMGHRIPNHKSKCRHLHGHRYKITVAVEGDIITTARSSDEGMVKDFGDIKEIMHEIITNKYDHAFCIYKDDVFVPYLYEARANKIFSRIRIIDKIPTAENLAIIWFDELKPHLPKLAYIEVFETPTSSAIYWPKKIIKSYPELKP